MQLHDEEVKVQFRGPELFLEKTGHYFKKNCAYLVSLCLHKQAGETIFNGWPQFVCNFNALSIWLGHTAAIASTWQPVPQPINGVTGTWLSCFAMCDWLRALVHLHHDHNVDDQNTVVLPIVGGRLAMLTEEKRNCSKLRKIHSGQGPISLTISPSEFKFFGQFVLLCFALIQI